MIRCPALNYQPDHCKQEPMILFAHRSKYFTLGLMALGLVVLMPRLGVAFEYIDGFDAVPVMSGLQQSEYGSLIFDKPGGRILEATLVGPVDHRAALRFYDTTLRSLGWTPIGPLSTDNVQYGREDEALQIEHVDAGSGETALIFRLNPAPTDR